MTAGEALYNFFSGFGIAAYPDTAVPDDVDMPYLVYSHEGGEMGTDVGMTADLWYYNAGETAPNAKAREIFYAIGAGGVILPCEDGAVWLKRGSPWCVPMGDETDKAITRRILNISAEHLYI